jgi:hypothetical protein
MTNTLKDKLDSIRAALDADVKGVDIDSLVEQGKALAQLIGLSAECKAEAKRQLERARVLAVASLSGKKLSPSVLLKLADSNCADEIYNFEYADRLNAGITHQLDYYRSVISLHKTELENSMKSNY